jgi:hypothetical protein
MEINLSRSPFKHYVLSNCSLTSWTKRRDLCGHLIREGGSTPNATFEYRRRAINDLVGLGYLEQTTCPSSHAIYVRLTEKGLHGLHPEHGKH